jgi:hypothetical protein
MTKTSRNVLIIIGAIAVLITGAAGYGVYKIYSIFSQGGIFGDMPAEIRNAGILKGRTFLSKKELFKMKEQSFWETVSNASKTKDNNERQKMLQGWTGQKLFSFTDIKVIGNEIVAAGNSKAFVFDLSGKQKREISFEPAQIKVKIGSYEQKSFQPFLTNLKIVQLNKHTFGFSSIDPVQGFQVFDDNGKLLWAYDKKQIELDLFGSRKEQKKSINEENYILEGCVGDLDNDGYAEYIVAINSDGIRAFNRSGKLQWFLPEEFPNYGLLIADVDGDGKNELLATGQGSMVLNSKGETKRNIEAGDLNPAILFRENNKKKSIVFCNINGNKLKCVDDTNAMVMAADAPLSEIPKKNPKKITIPDHPEMSYMDDRTCADFPQAVWVTFRKDQPRYLALVDPFIGLKRSHFYLYNDKGNLVYHELLPEEAKVIGVLPAANEEQEIIIAGKSLWKYSLN